MCLGILIDAKLGKISIPDNKLKEIKVACNFWLNKTHVDVSTTPRKFIGKNSIYS